MYTRLEDTAIDAGVWSMPMKKSGKYIKGPHSQDFTWKKDAVKLKSLKGLLPAFEFLFPIGWWIYTGILLQVLKIDMGSLMAFEKLQEHIRALFKSEGDVCSQLLRTHMKFKN